MSTYGKVCGWLLIPGLLAAFLLIARSGKIHNDWSATLSAAQQKAENVAESHREQNRELVAAENELARLQLGWDKSWDIANSGNTGVLAQDDHIEVVGLGSAVGLVPLEYTDDSDQKRIEAPTLHAFKAMPEGGVRYIGEFVVQMQQNRIPPGNVVLVPTWQFTRDDVQLWKDYPQGAWRFRTLIPAGARGQIDQLNVQLNRLNELYIEIDANFAQQDALLKAAEAQLTVRKQELLGNSAAESTPGRPEFNEGLLKTIRAEEDRRNNQQVEVDWLRRAIKSASEAREDIIRQLNELMARLPDDGQAWLTQETDGKVR